MHEIADIVHLTTVIVHLTTDIVHLTTDIVHLTTDLVHLMLPFHLLYPHKLCLWWVYCFQVVRVCVRPSVTFCFFNILKSHCWIFIKPCKHVHICKTNTLDKKVRARGQFY